MKNDSKNVDRYINPWKITSPFDYVFENFNNLFDDKFNSFKNVEYPYECDKYHKYFSSMGNANIIDNDNSFDLEISAPGFNKNELSLELKDGYLIVRGNKTSEKKEDNKKYFKKEFKNSSFHRKFEIPENITEEIEAQYVNGILYVSIKKREELKKETKIIEIK